MPICEEAGPHVRCIRQENAGPAAARNLGVAQASTDLIVFTDDDCRPDRDWARQLVAAHDGVEDRLVGGRVNNGLADNAFSSASQAILTYSYGHFDDFADELAFFTTNNMAVSRAKFLSLGGFDKGYDFASEDRDFCFRWRRAGGHLRYTPKAIVTHLHVQRLGGFLRQQYAYGRGARRFHRRVRQLSDARVQLGTGNFYAGLLLHPLRTLTLSGVLRTALIGLAHVAMTAGYIREGWRETGAR